MMSSRLLRPQQHEQRLSRALVDRAFDARQARATRARSTATLRDAPGASTPSGSCSSLARRPDVHVLAGGARAERGPGRRLRRARRAGQRDARAAHAVRRAGQPHLRSRRPSSTTASRSRSRRGGFGGMLVKPWDERKRSIFPIQEELVGKLGDDHGRARAGVPAAGAAERRASSRSSSSSRRRRATKSSCASPQQLVARGGQERPVRLPAASPTCSIDQAKTRDRHRPRQGRVDGPHACSRSAPTSRRCSAATSSTASTSTGAATRSSRRSSAPARLTPDQLEDIHITGPGRPAHAAQRRRHAHARRRAAHAQPLPAAQRGQDLRRRAARRSTTASRCSRTPRRKILPPGYRVDYTGESRQLRQEAGKFLPGDGPRDRPHLPGARGAVQLVPRSVRHPRRARCRWRCSAR